MSFDEQIASAVLAGRQESVTDAFDSHYRRPLLQHGRSLRGGEEIAAQVLTDALMEWWHYGPRGPKLRPPIVVSWLHSAPPRGPLEHYLKMCINTRLRVRAIRSAKENQVSMSDQKSEFLRELRTEDASVGDAEPGCAQAACACWVAAVREVATAHPRATLCHWLVAQCERQPSALPVLLYPATETKDEDARWRENPGTIPRLLAQFDKHLARAKARHADAACLAPAALEDAQVGFGSWLVWGEWPDQVTRPPLTEPEKSRVEALRHGVPTVERRATVAWLMERPDAVRWLARKLPAQGSRRPKEAEDASSETSLSRPRPGLPVVEGLVGERGKIYTAALLHARAMEPARLAPKLGQIVRRVFACLLSATGAGSGTLWLRQGATLSAVVNPAEKEMIGLSVPADRGFVHQVLLHEEPIRVLLQGSERRHWKDIDHRLRRQVGAMVAVPYRQFGDVVGVITLVRFAPDAVPFSLADVADAVHFAEFAGGSVEARLQRDAVRRAHAMQPLLDCTLTEVVERTMPADLWRTVLVHATDGQLPNDEFHRLLKRLFTWVLAEASAGAGTLWLQRGDDLEAVLNPHEPGMIGQRHPWNEGIIGSVFRSGKPERVAQARHDGRHSPRIDAEVACRPTQAMVAVPFILHGRRCGVVSMVRHLPDPEPFDAESARLASLLAKLLSRRFEDTLRFGLLDPRPEINWARENRSFAG